MGSAKKKLARKTNTLFTDPLAVRWSEKYSNVFEKCWQNIPDWVRPTLVTVAVFSLGISIRGEWILLALHFCRHLGLHVPEVSNNTFSFSNITMESLRMKNLSYFVVSSMGVSFGMFFLVGGFLHWYWYVRQRDQAHIWKCQPTKWLSPELERHEILLGSFSLVITSIFSGCVTCYIFNGGWSTIYYNFDEYGWLWWFLQWPVIFIYQDYITYWGHRIYHTPFLYKNFHKLHHKYKQPTAFSVTAIHPVEIVNMQILLMTPLLMFPVHYCPFYTIAMYTYYHGIIDHSGINFKSFWWQPWQPDAIFHDNHHQYFHVNFAFNIYIWDKLHGTYRQKDRLYTEDTYYGKGKALKDATEAEFQADMEQRKSENPLAYRSNKNDFEMKSSDINNVIQRKKKLKKVKSAQ